MNKFNPGDIISLKHRSQFSALDMGINIWSFTKQKWIRFGQETIGMIIKVERSGNVKALIGTDMCYVERESVKKLNNTLSIIDGQHNEK